MAHDFIPRPDLDALLFFQRFVAGLEQDPQTYPVPIKTVREARQAVGAFDATYAAYSDAMRRNTLSVIDKDRARASAERYVRGIARLLRADASLDGTAFVGLGLRPPARRRAFVKPPATAPWLSVRVADNTHVVTFHDAASSRRGKPAGAESMRLLRRFDEGSYELVGCYGRSPIVVEYDCRDHLRQATYKGCWMSRRGQVGPCGNLTEAFVVSTNPPRVGLQVPGGTTDGQAA